MQVLKSIVFAIAIMFRIPLYQTYLLQTENYEFLRYLRTVWRTGGIPRGAPRKDLRWTPKLTATVALAWTLAAALAALMGWSTYRGGRAAAAIFAAAVVFLVAHRLHFLFLAAVTLALLPADRFLKNRIIRRAALKIRGLPRLRVVAIAGSYGKTTTKELAAAVLAKRFRVVKTPENVNTLLGVAEVILRDLAPDTEIFVVEMGEHYPGDIRDLCRLVPPDLGITTGIAESHLERFGSLDCLAGTIFELAEHAKPGAALILNADSPLVGERYAKHVGGREIEWYGVRNPALSSWVVAKEKFHSDGSGQEFELRWEEVSAGRFRTALLGDYIKGTATAGLALARRFSISVDDAREALASLAPVPHRLQVVRAPGGAIVIDDSYNGNPEGVAEAIAVLGRFSGRRKLYITPGLVEMGVQTETVHREIGRKLAPVADLVILIRTSVAPFIVEGLREAGFSPQKIKEFPTAAAAHAALAGIVESNDAILFQNDWTDNYV